MKAKDRLAEFDSLENKKFNEGHINAALNKLQHEIKENPSIEVLAETMAFNFVEEYNHAKTGWGTYFGPIAVWSNDDGTASESPSIRLVTSEILEHWERRAYETINPILTARYCGLVYDFSKKIIGKNSTYQITNKYIKSLIEVANGNFGNKPINAYKKLKRALNLSISISNKELIEEAKVAIINYEKRNSEDSKPGLWGYSFDLLINNKKIKLSFDEEKDIIDDLKNIFRRTSNMDLPETFNLWSAENSFKRLSYYFNNRNDNNELKSIIDALILSYESSIKNEEPMKAVNTLEKMFEIYKQHGYKIKAEEILTRIRELGPEVFKNMKKIPLEFTIENQLIEKLISEMLKGESIQVFHRIALHYIPRREQMEKELYDNSKKNPLLYIISKQIQDSKGRTVAKIGSLEDDFEGHLVQQISLNIQLSSFLLEMVIDRAVKENKIDKTKILDYIMLSPIIDKQRFKIIEQSIEALFNNDYIVFLHLVIPQIEEAIRNMVELNGGAVLKQKNEVYQLKTFDELLRDEIISINMGQDVALYFRIIFTDQRGLNLRNTILHGITDRKSFTKTTSFRVLHCLLILGLVQENTELPA